MPKVRRSAFFPLAILVALSPLTLSAQRIVASVGDFLGLGSLAVDTVHNRVYVAYSQSLAVIDGGTNQVIATVNVGHNPSSPVVNTTTNKVYVPNGRDNTVTVVDGTTFTTSTVNVGVGPATAAVNSVTNKIYVANSDDNTVTVIDGNTLATTTVAVDEGPLAITVNSVTNKIYVGNQRFIGGSSITVIDGGTNHTQTVPLPFAAYFASGSESLLVDTSNNQIYALGENLLYFVLDGATNSVNYYFWPLNGCVQAMALNPVTHHIYGPDPCSGTVADINETTGEGDSLYAGFDPNVYVSVDSVRNRVYVSDPYSNSTSVLDRQLGTYTTFARQAASGDLVTNPVTNTTYVNSVFETGKVDVVAGASAMQFVAAAPCRVLDTRSSGGPIQGGIQQNVAVLSAGCNIPSNAAAYSLNVTLVPVDGGPVSYLTIWPTDQFRPTVSTMNSFDGRTKANAAIVSAGSFGAVSVYVSDTTNVVIDIDGYFAPNSGSTLAFFPLAPCRIIDTRGTTGDLGGPYLHGGAERDFPILESSCIPANANAQAYSFNLTAIPHQGHALDYLTVWPQGQTKPLVSTLNNPTATIVANAAIMPAGHDGGIAVYPSNDTDLVVDINGYFAAPSSGGLSLYATAPCRVLDTRQTSGAFTGELTVDVSRGCTLPGATQAYVFNATVVPQGSFGYLTLWPDLQDRPLASTLNAIDGQITSNMAIVQTTNHMIDAYASGLTQLILDISSYFAP